MKENNRFDMAVLLTKSLGDMKLGTGKTFSEALCLGHDISLWDVIAPYLTLHRFSLLFSTNQRKTTFREFLKYWIRPYRGVLASAMELISSHFGRKSVVRGDIRKKEQTVIFIGFIPNFFRDVLRPVAESMTTVSGIRVVVIGENKKLLSDDSSRGKVLYHSIWDNWPGDIKTKSKEMVQCLKTFEKTLSIRNLVDTFGNSGLKINKYKIEREFKWLFRRGLRRLIKQVVVADRILDHYKPALIVSADDTEQRCRIYSLLANSRNIPSLLIQQGLSGKDYPEWKFFSHTAVAAMGMDASADMIKQGISPEKITITGHPGFDQLKIIDRKLNTRIRSQLGIETKEKMILFVSQPYYVGAFSSAAARMEMIRAIAKVCSSIKGTRLIVKPHPGDRIQSLKKIIGKERRAIFIDKKKDIVPLVKASDVVVTFFSTVALQAIYAGRPVVNVAFPGSGGLRLYRESGATWVARSKDEIGEYIRLLIGETKMKEIASKEDARKEFLKKIAFKPDGGATDRVLELALKMVDTGG